MNPFNVSNAMGRINGDNRIAKTFDSKILIVRYFDWKCRMNNPKNRKNKKKTKTNGIKIIVEKGDDGRQR